MALGGTQETDCSKQLRKKWKSCLIHTFTENINFLSSCLPCLALSMTPLILRPAQKESFCSPSGHCIARCLKQHNANIFLCQASANDRLLLSPLQQLLIDSLQTTINQNGYTAGVLAKLRHFNEVQCYLHEVLS